MSNIYKDCYHFCGWEYYFCFVGRRHFGKGGYWDSGPWDVEFLHWGAVDVEFFDEDVDVHVVEGGAGNVDNSFGDTDDLCCFVGGVGKRHRVSGFRIVAGTLDGCIGLRRLEGEFVLGMEVELFVLYSGHRKGFFNHIFDGSFGAEP